MDHVSLNEILSSNPALAHATEGLEREPKTRIYEFHLPSRVVEVHSTAHKVMDAIVRFAWKDQILIIQGIVDRLPNFGDHMILNDDVFSRERAVVMLCRTEGPGVRLVFTR